MVIRVLIADDSFLMRKVLTDIVNSDSNLEVVGTASTGLEAIKLTKQLKPDVITLDMQMPVMDGFEATKYIRTEMDAPKKNLPIIALTADVMLSEKTRAFEAGISDYITKPFDANKLFASITRLLQ